MSAHQDIDHCLRMITRDEQAVAAAPSHEAAEAHEQMAMLYRAQVQHLRQAAYRRRSLDYARSSISDEA